MTDRNKMIMQIFPPENTWEKNYRAIIDFGKKLEKFNEEDKKDKWLIKACQSPLWLKPEMGDSGQIIFMGDSEGLITKGILAIIIKFYTKRTAQEILQDPPLFIEQLQLSRYLSLRRTNGIGSLLDQVLQYARAFSALSSAPNPAFIGQKS